MLSREFQELTIDWIAVSDAVRAYEEDANGRFYAETYGPILDLFGLSDISTQQKVVACWSWMSGNYKPTHLQRLDGLFVLRPESLHELTSANCALNIDMYVEAERVLGTVGASKFLHFAFPNSFVMWDDKIRCYSLTLATASRNQESLYKQFCLCLADKIRVAPRPADLASSVTTPRLLDMWLWTIAGL